MIKILGFIADFFNNIKLIYYYSTKPDISPELLSKFEEFDFFLNSTKCILVKHKSDIWVFCFNKIRFFDISCKTPFFDEICPDYRNNYNKIKPYIPKFMHWKYFKNKNDNHLISLKNTNNLLITLNYNNNPCYNLSMIFDPFSTKFYILQNIYNSFSENHNTAIMQTSFDKKIKSSDFYEELFKKCQQIAYSPQNLSLYFVDKK